jgi:hypothetical protein
MEGSGDDEHDEDVLEGEVTDGKVEMVMSEEAGSALDNTAQSPILKVTMHLDQKKQKICSPLARYHSGNNDLIRNGSWFFSCCKARF